ncbi:hypothetical protein [Fibrella aquatica]|uniref:hypothetical protein n=1 Tax=Fibrella aquatica TaxID=3242487 RepID=UPI003520D7D6
MKKHYAIGVLLATYLLACSTVSVAQQVAATASTTAPDAGKDVKQVKPDSLLQTLDLSDLIAIGYKGGEMNREMALTIMRKVATGLTGTTKKDTLWRTRLKKFLDQKHKHWDSLNRKVVFIYVPADATKLKKVNLPNDSTALRKKYLAAEDKPESVRRIIKSEDNVFVEQIERTRQAIVTAVQNGETTALKALSEQANLLATERKRTSEFNTENLKKAVSDSLQAWNALFYLKPRYVESGKPQSLVFGKKRDLDYLSQVREGLVVVVGNSDSLRNLSLFVKKGERLIKSEAADVPLIYKTITDEEILRESNKSPETAPELSTVQQTIAVRLFFIDSAQTSPVYSLTAAMRGGRFTYKIHEPVFFRLKLGFAAGRQDVNYFKLQNQQLVFGPDSLRKQDIKANLTLMLDFSLWPRHIDYLRPFRVWENVPSRLSLATGLKIGKDPFESIYGGINYAITKDINLSSGIAWHSDELTNIEPINTPSNIVGYLRNNKGRGYNRRFFLGIALSPSAIIKVLGIKKDE